MNFVKLGNLTPLSPKPVISPSSNYITQWNVGSRKICIFREQDSLAFSVEGRDGPKTHFSPLQYDIHYAVNLILLFKKTILRNLENDEPNPSCFLPLLLQPIEGRAEAQVALFGRVSVQEDNSDGVLKGLRWGVFYPSTGDEQTLEVRDHCSKEFVRGALNSSLSDEGYFSQENNRRYLKRFKTEVSCDLTGRIQRISLKYQRSWFETGGQSCDAALMEYLSDCENGHLLQTLRLLGLSPDQISIRCTEVEVAYFRTLMEKLGHQSKIQQELIFANLEIHYPTIFPILLEELIQRSIAAESPNEYESIFASLKRGVLGQDTAAEFLAAALNSQKQRDGQAVFLFVGPTGVGKTELAKVAASHKQNRFVKFNMDQFKGQVDFYKLFGSPAGHVGSTDQPLFAKELEKYASPLGSTAIPVLTRTVTDAIIVFDELEKAHAEVKQSLLNLFDEGYCKIQYTLDDKNLTINYVFNKCIFIGTSNLYKDEILADFRRKTAPDLIAENFIRLNEQRPSAQSYSPELLGRLKVVAFGPIPREVYSNLVQNKLPVLLSELQSSVNCPNVQIIERDLPDVLRLFEAKLYGDGTGIRKVKRYFELEIKTAIYKQTAWGNLTDKQITITSFNRDQLGLKCVRTIYGRVVQEFPVVPI